MFTLSLNDKSQLVLHREVQDDVVDVRLRRSFPWTRPTELVSIRDDKGKEVVLIERLEDLEIEQRKLVEHWLAQNSFLPEIISVMKVNNDFGYQLWHVLTDRGPVEFRVQEREDIRFLPDGRFSVKDVDGNIYVMPRADRLDPASQKAIQGII